MATIRHIKVEHFRGFAAFETVLRDHAVLVGEPGAGRSDLLEAIGRVLDPDSLRQRRGSEMDFANADVSEDVFIELTIINLTPAITTALTRYLEVWDTYDDELRSAFTRGEVFDPDRHLVAVRFGYRLWSDADQLHETIYWPKFADRAAGLYPPVRQIEREQIPFLFQRGLGTRPLDLAPRGDFRNAISQQPAAAGFAAAVETFMASVEAGAAVFAADPAVSSALEEVLREVRQARRLHETRPATDILTFLPDGGSEAGLLRTLEAAATIDGAPPNLPMSRHGASLLAAMRGGLLAAAASRVEGTIVVVDDLGGEIDPHLARHLAARIRDAAGQLIAATRSGLVVEAFAPDEVLRLHMTAGVRSASAGQRPRSKPQRLAARYYARYLVPALHASSVVIVEGHTDRLGFGTLADKARDERRLGSFDAAGVAIIEAGTNGQAPRLAEAARALGIFAIVLLDNEAGAPAAGDPVVASCVAAADAVVRLPPRVSVERALLNGVPDAELVRVFQEIDLAVGGLTLPTGWERLAGAALVTALARVMHDRTGSVHAIYVEALDPTLLPPVGLHALEEVLRIARNRATGLVELT
jgi:hypothetical protein